MNQEPDEDCYLSQLSRSTCDDVNVTVGEDGLDVEEDDDDDDDDEDDDVEEEEDDRLDVNLDDEDADDEHEVQDLIEQEVEINLDAELEQDDEFKHIMGFVNNDNNESCDDDVEECSDEDDEDNNDADNDDDEDDDEEIYSNQPDENVESHSNSESPSNDVDEQMKEESIDMSVEEEVNNMLRDKEERPGDETPPENVVKWAHFTGLRVKQFTIQELEAFKKPFEIGWKREVVLRGTVTNSGKKIGDVYYFSPDKKIKLRSYVEMGLYLKKHQNCGLEPENFTFARQPIYKTPEEVVRHAMQRGGTQPPQVPESAANGNQSAAAETPTANVNTPDNSSKVKYEPPVSRSASESGAEEFHASAKSVAEGRAKRKRVAPTRFEDEDFAEQSPFKKKTKDKVAPIQPTPVQGKPLNPIKITINSSSEAVITSNSVTAKPQQQQAPPVTADAITTVPVVTTSENKKQKSQSLLQPMSSNSNQPANKLQQNIQHVAPQQIAPAQSTPVVTTATAKQAPSNSSLPTPSSSARKSTSSSHKGSLLSSSSQPKLPPLRVKMSNFKPIKPKPPEQDMTMSIGSEVIHETSVKTSNASSQSPASSSQPIAPCSIMCNGRRGMLPNLLCSRCLCLFHLECVPTGLYLKEPHQFICPNCVQPGDREMEEKMSSSRGAVNGIDNMSLYQDNSRVMKLEQSKSQPILVHSPLFIQSLQSNGKQFRSYAPILPKPAVAQMPIAGQFLTQIQSQPMIHTQQQGHKMLQGHIQPGMLQYQANNKAGQSVPCSSVNVKLPPGTQLYRLGGSPPQHMKKSGHSATHLGMKSTSMTVTPMQQHSTLGSSKSARKSINAVQSRRAQVQHIAQVHNSLKHDGSATSLLTASLQKMSNKLMQQQQQLAIRRAKAETEFRKAKRGYREYMINQASGLSKFLTGYECLNQVLGYLNASDLINLRVVNASLNHLASQPIAWKRIKLKGILIKDWQYLGRNIIEPFATTDIDFDGIRCQRDGDLCEMWRQFPSIIDYLKSVKHMKFGNIPSFVLEEILNTAITENPYNCFSSLESLDIRNMFDEESEQKQCNLNVLELLSYLTNLRKLSLKCCKGFIGNEDVGFMLSKLFCDMQNLRCLTLQNLKGLHSEQFHFLGELKQLEHLEIGSCESWTTSTTPEMPDNLSKESETEETRQLTGAFVHLSKLTNLRSLKLVEVIIDEASSQLPSALEKMISLESLTLELVTISPDAAEILELLSTTVKSTLTSLKRFSISTDDPHTNKCVFDLLKKMTGSGLKRVEWKVGAIVEDSGECFVPFSKEREDSSEMEGDNIDLTNSSENLETMDMNFLNVLLQNGLPDTEVQIVPQ